jgi:hypothetical protein
MPHEDAQAYSSPAKKKRDTLPKQRVTSLAQETILGRKVSWLLAHIYEHAERKAIGNPPRRCCR